MQDSSNRITINIGGVKFETYASTLQRFPGTKLSILAEPQASSTFDFDQKRNEFFFDRNAEIFGCVLEYYRTGHLHFPGDICRSVLVEELSFWEINDTQMAHCCWLKLNSRDGILDEFSIWDENSQTDRQGLVTPTGRTDFSWKARWQPRIWPLLNAPFSSVAAIIVALFSLLFTIGAIAIFFQETKDQFLFEATITNSTQASTVHNFMMELAYTRSSYLLYLELVCVLWFIAEFSLRCFFSPDKKDFLLNVMNIIDFCSLFPVFIELCAVGQPGTLAVLWISLGFMRISYIVRLLRFFKLLENVLIIRVLSRTLKSIIREILILLLALAFETLFFATLMFFAEFFTSEYNLYHDRYFSDIYATCWWAVITLTTVGYGDMYPMSTYGKVVAALAAMSGILTIVIPIPILMIKFQHYYNIAMAHEKLQSRRKKYTSR